MRRIVNIAGVVMICVLLSGCCITHEWEDATCVMPKTCSTCEEIQGEPLGHTWEEANCEEAKHCTVCGLTEGNALEHQWSEADYENPKMCNVCGKTEGERLKTFLEEYGIDVDRELNKEYIYETVTSTNNPNPERVKGKLVFTNKEIVKEKEGYEAQEGYKWCILNTCTVFRASEYPITHKKGVNMAWRYTDAKTGINVFTEPDGTINDQGEVVDVRVWNIDGKDMTVTVKTSLESEWRNEDDGKVLYVWDEVGVKVPEDYNDLVICIANTPLLMGGAEVGKINEENFLAISFEE